jgi:hypothetical protein
MQRTGKHKGIREKREDIKVIFERLLRSLLGFVTGKSSSKAGFSGEKWRITTLFGIFFG